MRGAACPINDVMLQEENVTCVETVRTGFDGFIPLLVLRAPNDDVPGEETHFGPALELGAIGQRDAHAEVSVLEWLVQGQGQTII